MKSLARLSLPIVLLAGAAAAQEPAGPRGSSEVAAGEERYDAVGTAGIGPAAGMTIQSVVLRPGEIAEVTALDSGRTVVVRVAAGAPQPGTVAQLSTVVADALGLVGDRVAVRVRRTAASPIDEARLNAGQAGEPRPDAPEVLLVPLRRKLAAVPGPPVATPRPVMAAPSHSEPRTAPVRRVLPPTPRATPLESPSVKAAPAAVARGDFVVRVGAYADAARARAVAARLGGRIVPVGRLSRVQLGPFADSASAERARARAVAAGFPDARRTLATAP